VEQYVVGDKLGLLLGDREEGALQYLYIVASAKYNLFLIIELIAWMSPKQVLPTNYIISIYIVIYDVSRCANIWLDFQSRETTLFKARLRRIEGHDLARFGSIRLVSILPGRQYFSRQSSISVAGKFA